MQPPTVLRRLVPRSPEGLLAGSFAALIGAGALLLWLPISHRGAVGPLDALFTSTSAVCVTGLVVVDTGSAFTPAGQVVILALIQMGGIGVMTFAALAYQLMGRRLSLRANAALADALVQRDVAGELGETFRGILRTVLVIESIGAATLFVGLVPRFGVGHAAWSAVFHSVSAFCNAGFALYPDSLVGLRSDLLAVGAVTALIILGGIGHPVLRDVWRALRGGADPRGRSRFATLSLHSRVALLTSAALIAGGTAAILVLGLTADESGAGAVGAAAFQSVTARTAGFNTVDIGLLPVPTLVLVIGLMFVGGSPGSCAGGIKTTTLVVWGARFLAAVRGEKQVRLLGRHIPGEIVRRSMLLLDLAVLWNVLGLFVLLQTEAGTAGADLVSVLFEQVSAFGTVGLSMGLTPHLSDTGRAWLIATMFVGRVGPLTVVLWITTRKDPGVQYPDGRLMIG
ncbi:MAG: potassium transporter TrkH [Myxococcales bacterium]